MELQLFCLFDPSCAPLSFDLNLDNKLQYTCKLPISSKVKQLMIFIQGQADCLKDNEIQVEITSSTLKHVLCNLSSEKRFYQMQDGPETSKAFPEGSSNKKMTLVATVTKSINGKDAEISVPNSGDELKSVSKTAESNGDIKRAAGSEETDKPLQKSKAERKKPQKQSKSLSCQEKQSTKQSIKGLEKEVKKSQKENKAPKKSVDVLKREKEEPCVSIQDSQNQEKSKEDVAKTQKKTKMTLKKTDKTIETKNDCTKIKSNEMEKKDTSTEEPKILTKKPKNQQAKKKTFLNIATSNLIPATKSCSNSKSKDLASQTVNKTFKDVLTNKNAASLAESSETKVQEPDVVKKSAKGECVINSKKPSKRASGGAIKQSKKPIQKSQDISTFFIQSKGKASSQIAHMQPIKSIQIEKTKVGEPKDLMEIENPKVDEPKDSIQIKNPKVGESFDDFMKSLVEKQVEEEDIISAKKRKMNVEVAIVKSAIAEKEISGEEGKPIKSASNTFKSSKLMKDETMPIKVSEEENIPSTPKSTKLIVTNTPKTTKLSEGEKFSRQSTPKTPKPCDGGEIQPMDTPKTPKPCDGGEIQPMDIPKTPKPCDGGEIQPMDTPKTTKRSRAKQTQVLKTPKTAILSDGDEVSGTPKLSKLSEGEEMQELNEKTPFETTKSPFPTPKMARKRKTENTPTPKSRRQRLTMKALAEMTPPASKTVLNEITNEDPLSAVNNLLPEKRVTRCVDLSARVPRPTSRWGHTLTPVSSTCAVVIGGQGEKQLCRDSVWQLNPEMRTWQSSEVVTEGAKPEYRVGHTATYDPVMRCIYVYGGSKNTKWFHDVHLFDLYENKWTLVKYNGKAPTRAYHTTTLFRHELWVVGGVFPRPDPQPDGCDNDVNIFSPIMESWYKPIVTGEKPRPRSGHSATCIGDRLIVFGGWDFPYCYDDVCILDLTTLDWSSPKVNGASPKPRSWHVDCPLANNRIFIHGGYDGDNALHDAHIFDLYSKTWFELALDNAPSARAGHTCLLLSSDYEDVEEDEVIVFGGGDNDGSYFSDMLSFYIPYEPKTLSFDQ